MKKSTVIILFVVAVAAIQVLIIRSKPKVVVPEDYFARNVPVESAPSAGDEEPTAQTGLAMEKPAAPQQLPFELLGTLIANGREPIAYLKDTRTGERKSYKTGAALQQYQIAKIALREVTLQSAEETRVLRMQQTAGSSPAEESTLSPIVEIAGGRMLVRKSALRPNFQQLVKQVSAVKLQPYYKDNSVAGMRIEGITNESILSQAGLRDRDIIQTVNDQQVTSYQKALQLAQRARTQQNLEVTIIRDGEPQRISYQIR